VTLEALARDALMGRGSGSESEKIAAGLISDRFKAYGLLSGPGGWEQLFQAQSRKSETLISSQNVLASLPGVGTLAGEWVVVGAHYDHIGIREEADGTSAINNGADDNASGTALLLEVARILQAQVDEGAIPAADRRSVLFVAFGAEEEGLLGSCHFAIVSSLVPISFTRAMMNFDMVGRLRDDVVQVRGFESSPDWANMVENANDPGLLLLDPPPCMACSDFACFRDRGVPYIWFFTGTHAQYHTPEDDVELINFPGLSEVGSLALRVLSRLLVMRNGPLAH
jgi:Zn-dependent M28 family amino/carboxypeptidase